MFEHKGRKVQTIYTEKLHLALFQYETSGPLKL